MLHIGENQAVDKQDIVVILPEKEPGEVKAHILLADGSELASTVSTATLKRRLIGDIFPK